MNTLVLTQLQQGKPAPAPDQKARRLTVDQRLNGFLEAWLGTWPPNGQHEILVWSGRDEPGWDGGTWLGLGVESPQGTVLSLSPRTGVDAAVLDRERVADALATSATDLAIPVADGQGTLSASRASFRWSDRPAPLPEIGEWVSPEDPRIPDWLKAFNGDVLVAWDDAGKVAAGVGRKMHNAYGHELAVVTEPEHQGKGLARKLVAQAARRVLAEGALPLYFHLADNLASARVADAAGFPDRGWKVLAIS